ncbi:hypothetical protein CRYPA_1763 [uncultured Candidatus Thioglobus sp.]|nr:hypothetical protein CRYPA_1763 [uncultured Candidatus Thioglobus sp.]
MNKSNLTTYPQIQAIKPTANMKSQDAINKRHRIQGGVMFIGGLVFAAAITAYAYNGHTNIFTFVGVAITLAGLVRLPQTESPVNGWSEYDHSNDSSPEQKHFDLAASGIEPYASSYGLGKV